MFIWIYAHASLKLNTHFQFLFRYMVCEFPWKLVTINSDLSRAKPLIGKLASFLPEDPDKTNPNSAEITTQLTGWSWPVNTARGVGVSASPTILWALAFQCHKRTVQSSDPEAKKRRKKTREIEWNKIIYRYNTRSGTGYFSFLISRNFLKTLTKKYFVL